jgi:lipoyl-dependent peroxiredoxin
MIKRQAHAKWEGTLKEGSGTMAFGSGAFEGAYSHKSRFAEGTGTNPEELIGAAHAGCFSMFLASVLTNNGYPPVRVETTAVVHLQTGEGGPTIVKIELTNESEVEGIEEAEFQEYVTTAKENCPVSKALAGPEIVVEATLKS